MMVMNVLVAQRHRCVVCAGSCCVLILQSKTLSNAIPKRRPIVVVSSCPRLSDRSPVAGLPVASLGRPRTNIVILHLPACLKELR